MTLTLKWDFHRKTNVFVMGLGQKPPDKKPPNNEKYKLFIYWYLCTHFGLIVPLFMG